MKRAVISGGNGYLGSHLARSLVLQGWNVVLIVRQSSSLARVRDFEESVTIVDSLQYASALEAIGPIDVLIHTATCYGRSGEQQSEIVASNLIFPLQLLEFAIAHRVTLFCNTDTVLDRDKNAYALSKKQFADWLKLIPRTGAIRALNLQLDHFYGPSESDLKFVAWTVRKCLSNEPRIPLTSGLQQRTFLHIRDLVRAYIAAIEHAIEGTASYSDFAIASETRIRVRDLVEKIHALTGSKSLLDFGAVPLEGRNPESPPDLSSIRDLGWSEEVALDEGLLEVINAERGIAVR